MRRFTVLTMVLIAIAAGPGAFGATITTVMSDLDNPRGLAFGPEGGLYVVEAGRGGAGPCQTLRGATQCYGPSGAVTRLWRGIQERIVTGLPSNAPSTGESAFGPADISFQGRGGAFVAIGFGGNPALRSGFGAPGALFGTLIQASAGKAWRVVADISAYEAVANPAGGLSIDSSPHGVLAEPGARIVADAGGNSLLRIAANGNISTIAVFPSRPDRTTDAVPTAVVRGPDGAYYVSELTGGPFFDEPANIYRVVPGLEPEVFLDGFRTVIDIDFGPDGSLYVLEHASAPVLNGPGRVIRVAQDGTRTVVIDNLTRPTSILVDGDGVIYVSNFGTSVGSGEVLRIEL